MSQPRRSFWIGRPHAGRPRLAPYCLNATSLVAALRPPKDTGAHTWCQQVLGGRAPATVSMDMTGAVPDEGRRLLIAACCLKGQPVIGRDRPVGARVRPSTGGTVHVLTVGDTAAGN